MRLEIFFQIYGFLHLFCIDLLLVLVRKKYAFHSGDDEHISFIY